MRRRILHLAMGFFLTLTLTSCGSGTGESSELVGTQSTGTARVTENAAVSTAAATTSAASETEQTQTTAVTSPTASKAEQTTAATTSAAKTTGSTAAPTKPLVPDSAKFTLKPGHQYVGHVEPIFEYSGYDNHTTIQGGTFEGKYYYVAIINKHMDPETCYICKYDLTGKLLKRSQKLVLDHANDITYVKKWNALLVSHCHGSNERIYYRYSLVNPDTFTIIKTEDLPKPFFGMDYCERRDSFASAEWNGSPIDIWKGDLSHQESFNVKETGNTPQGVATDENYVYFLQWRTNSVQVYDWEGNHAFEILLDMMNGDPEYISGEPEHISIVDGVMYIGGNNRSWTGGYFAYVSLEDVTGK